MLNRDKAPAMPLERPFARRGDAPVGMSERNAPVEGDGLMERVVESSTLSAAVNRVKQHGGSPGIDGRMVAARPGDLDTHWPEIREALLSGTYTPQPVKRVEIPKPHGGGRKLGMPTVLDRCIQQARLQVLQPAEEASVSGSRDGFRPGRSAHQAIAQAQHDLETGDSWVVDLDREQCCDRVNHDKLMSRVTVRVTDRRVLKLVDRFLKAGALTGDDWEATEAGTPPGGPLSPRLANRLLDGLDKELERRGHRVVRDADDWHISVRSARAGRRVLARMTRFLSRKLTRSVNEAKRAGGRSWRRTFLGFRFTGCRPNRRTVSGKAFKRFKAEIRRRTQRTRGVSLPRVGRDVRQYLDGWCAYVG